MEILVAGGAGYIGSHMVNALRQADCKVVVLDDLSAGHPDAVFDAELIVGSLADGELLDRLLGARKFDAVMHFASFIQVGESVRDPAAYYRNNLINTLNLLDAMIAHQVHHFVFSSTAAIFGEPERTPIDERHRAAPINPYGQSKWMVEQILSDYEKAYGLQSVCLRYFNAAGANAIVKIGAGGTGITAAKNIKALGLKTLLLIGDDTLSSFKAAAEVLGDQLLFPADPTQMYSTAGAQRDTLTAFMKPWMAKYGNRSAAYGAPGWDAVMMLAKATETARSVSGPALRDAIEKLSDYRGVYRYHFSADNHVGITENPFVMARFKDDRVVLVE